jgi:hypothetical protein
MAGVIMDIFSEYEATRKVTPRAFESDGDIYSQVDILYAASHSLFQQSQELVRQSRALRGLDENGYALR